MIKSSAVTEFAPAPVFDPSARPLISDELEQYRSECLVPCTDITDLPYHFDRLPNDVAYWGRVLGNAIAYASACEAHYRHVAGVLHALYTTKLLALKGKAITAAVEAHVRADPNYTAAKVAVGQADGLVAEIRETLAALRRKGDALVNMGATRRTEYDAHRVAGNA